MLFRKSNKSQPSDHLSISLTSHFPQPLSFISPNNFSPVCIYLYLIFQFNLIWQLNSTTTMAVDLVGIQAVEHLNRIFQNHDFAVPSNFKQAVSALKRSGHARFRRGPSPSSPSDPHAPSVSSQSEEKLPKQPPVTDATSSFQSMTSSPVLSLAEGSVSNGKQLSSLGIVAPAPSFSSRKPPLPSSHRKRLSTDSPSVSVHGSKGENHSVSRSSCHCCKKRYEMNN